MKFPLSQCYVSPVERIDDISIDSMLNFSNGEKW